MGEFDIKSTTLDKGLDIIKDLLGKLVSPTIEQTGELIADKIRFVRWKQQVQILEKAKQYIEERNISVKSIPVKILVPLLENASLEENEEMQDKWAKMITNMADSETNLQNQIFPYILGQISSSEYRGLLELNKMEMELKELYKEQNNISCQIKRRGYKELEKINAQIKTYEQDGFMLDVDEGYEIANLERLGLIKQLPLKITVDEFKIAEKESLEQGEDWHKLTVDYLQDGSWFRMTELGESFMKLCEFYDN